MLILVKGNGSMKLTGYRINMKLTTESRKMSQCSRMWEVLQVGGLLIKNVKNEVGLLSCSF